MPVRFPEGCREFTEEGEELFAILEKNIYGSPLAPRNFSKYLRAWILTEMGVDKGWKVIAMELEPCLYKIEIEGRVSFINVWTDDCDGVCDDPRDGKAIRQAFDQKFGVTECDPRHMLGVNCDLYLSHSQFISCPSYRFCWSCLPPHRLHRLRQGYQTPPAPLPRLCCCA